MTKRKYYKSLEDALEACKREQKAGRREIHVYKMSKGTRHHGEYAVCSYMEWINTD